MKLCKDCKHFQVRATHHFYRPPTCVSPKVALVNPITGGWLPVDLAAMRTTGECGLEARHFEPIPAKRPWWKFWEAKDGQ
jgi:hypothetical protein